MAVTKTEVLVNSGNTGWTKRNVIDALETTFANLGWHGGTAKTGVATTIFAPGDNVPANQSGSDNWRYTSSAVGYAGGGYAIATFEITNNGSTAYTIKKRHSVDYVYSDDTIRFDHKHRLSTGDAIVYSVPAGSEIVISSGTLTSDTTYYAIRIDDETIKLATSSENASAGTAIDITSQRNNVSNEFFYQILGDNADIEVYQGDRIDFVLNASGHPFYIADQGGSYDSSRIINTTNYNSNGRSFPNLQGIESGTITWDVEGWEQGDYYYLCQNHPASMTGTIRVLPSTYKYYNGPDGTIYPYWDYTVPTSGSREALNLRVYRWDRSNSYNGDIQRIEILNEASGWSNEEVFTIPGDQIGGSTPQHDVTFGINSATSQEQVDRTGVPSIRVSDVGGGTTFYQKLGGVNGNSAILKLVNDQAKTYGTTYWGFLVDDNNYDLHIKSGTEWNYRNWDPESGTYSRRGRYGGVVGLDLSAAHSDGVFDNETNYDVWSIRFATTSTPTAYPLKVVTHAANSPQDTNFVLVSFVQTINSVDVVYDSFFLHKGTILGSGIWDLDYVWQGCFTKITKGSGLDGIELNTFPPTRYYQSQEGDSTNPHSLKREAFYGYYREGSDINYNSGFNMKLENNIFVENNLYSSRSVVGYYRNSTYDKASNTYANSTNDNKNDVVSTHSVASEANFYKPFKGIPLSNNLMPCPYYLPDDFVAIQFAVNPGATAFNYGDTITVNGSEIYEIIQVDYTTNVTSLDGVTGNTSQGIAFCARVTV